VRVGGVERVLAQHVDVGVRGLGDESAAGRRGDVGVGVLFELVEADLAVGTRSASDAGVASVMPASPRGAC